MLGAWLTSLVLLVSCGGGSAPGSSEQVLPPGRAQLIERDISWALGSTIHHGETTYDVSPHVIRGLVPTAYGWFVRLAETFADGSGSRWSFFDGEELHPISEDARTVHASPDGRYAGWVDRHGPLRPAGRIAKVVVVDLVTGEVVLDTHDGMGGGLGDDLEARYSELPPTFLGFDDEFAYWTDAEGHGTRTRWSRVTGVTERAEREGGGEGPEHLGRPVDQYSGSPIGVQDGRAVHDGGTAGRLSPDGRYIAETGFTGRLSFYSARTGRPVRADLGHRWAFFGGWLDDDRIYVLTRDRFSDGFDPSKPDRTTGFLTLCSLDTGRCRDLEEVTGTYRVAFPGTDSPFYG